jgi:hypothetical protein
MRGKELLRILYTNTKPFNHTALNLLTRIVANFHCLGRPVAFGRVAGIEDAPFASHASRNGNAVDMVS